jgi:SAM-dependent methyltransferase
VDELKFEDHFSRIARTYAEHRPSYPAALFAYLATLAPGRDIAWDCGTGNGQAALELVRYFHHVYATDASAQQIGMAHPHERIEYRVEPAEEVSLADGCVDLITVAIAVHWFDLARFYAEARRVLRPAGVIAVWTYHLPVVTPQIDAVVLRYYRDVLAGCWSSRFGYVDRRYADLPFPFAEQEPPPFEVTADWDLHAFAAFLGTWSAAHVYQERHGRHPLGGLWNELEAAWGERAGKRLVRWPLHLRVGIHLPTVGPASRRSSE